jgi:hypothetical protein
MIRYSKTIQTVRKLLLLFFIITIALSGCKKDDSSVDKTNKGALSGNVLKGKINGWTLGEGYTIEARKNIQNSELYGSAIISPNGSFRMNLKVPPEELLSITTYFSSPLSVSDTDAECIYFFFFYIINTSSGEHIGSISRCNNLNYNEKGYAFVVYMYSSKKATVTGTETSGSDNYKFNLKLESGWNTVVQKFTNIRGTECDFEIENNEPTDIIWKFAGN